MPDMNMQTFEEVRRHQLVTEFDVQSQSDLADYQVQLENVDNLTQAQDNLIVGVGGESLPHWNESVDFDTWVKMKIESSGKRGLLIHGNAGLNSESSITDTMIFGDDFSGNLSKWEGDTSIGSISSGILTISGTGNNYKMNGITDIPQECIVRFRGNIVPKDDYMFGLFSQASFLVDDIEYYTGLTDARLYSSVSSTRTYISIDSPTSGYKNYDIVYRSGNVHIFVNDVEDANSPKTTNVPSSSLPVGFRTVEDNNDWFFDYIYARKYTATEPTVQISTPKNISTALKSFGRAG